MSQWLSDTTGIDFPALEAMEPPSLWDFEDWVPWLASRIWVNVGLPLACLLIALFETSFGLAFLNWLDWFVRQPGIIAAWFGGWYLPLLIDIGKWLLWFTNPILTAPLLLSQFFFNSQQTLNWLGSLPGWFSDLLQSIFYWSFGVFTAWAITILNFLITAWNILLPTISAALSEMVSVLVSIWNNWLAPFLSRFGNVWEFVLFLIDQLGVVGDLIVFFFQTVWQFVLMVWDFLSGTATLPVQFYFAFNNSVDSTAFELIPECTGDITNDWCVVLGGIEVVNQSIAHSVAYPLVIVGIIVATIVIFWRHVWELLTFKIR